MSEWRVFGGTAEEWDAALIRLPGANFYQCHAWGEVKHRLGWQVLRLICVAEQDTAPRGAAQVLLRRYPLGLGLAWIPGGVAGQVQDWGVALPAAISRICRARFIYIRVNALHEVKSGYGAALKAAGWTRPQARLNTGLSLRHELASSEKVRLVAASGNWRHNFKRASRHGLKIQLWDAPDSAAIRAVYEAMEVHKGLAQQITPDELAGYLDLLGKRLILMRCCDLAGETIAVRACALFGDTAWDLMAATTPAARKVYASHATLWALLNACAALGVKSYDLGGIDPEGNKGVFDFKQGVGAERIEYLGEWEWASNSLVRFVANRAIRRRGAGL